jgi:uncharacterized membrane protein YtjA (UPF0391 family)
MKKNMGKADRLIRTIVALIIGFLLFNGTISGTLGTILAVVAIAFLVTSLISWCPAYLPFGISTGEKSAD